jgi:hypothetical protein
MLHNRRKTTQQDDPSRPRLRRAPGAGSGPVDAGDDSNSKTQTDTDDRPTLKRRDGGSSDSGSGGGQ